MADAVWDEQGNRVMPEDWQEITELTVLEELSPEDIYALDPITAMQQEIDELKAALLAVQSPTPDPDQQELF